MIPTSAAERDRLAVLHRLNLLDPEPDPVLDDISALTATILKMPIALVSVIGETQQKFKSKFGIATNATPREQSFCEHAISEPGEIMVISDAALDTRFSDNPLVVGEPGIRFYAGAPLVVEPGIAVGALCVIDRTPRTSFSPDERNILKQLSTLAAHYLNRQRYHSNSDPATGLPNRKQFLEDIADLIAQESAGTAPFSVAVVDALEADEFNQLIRILGHAHIDALLASIAAILKVILPAETKLYHLGIFRFGFVLTGVLHLQVSRLLEEVAAGLREPIACGGVPVVASAYIGVARFAEDGASAINLVRGAVAAAHEASKRKTVWARYDDMSDRASGRAFRLLADLRGALAAEGQLVVHYQPKVRLVDGACVGAEALIRWQHPEFGWVSPAEFVPLAEKTALMRPLTDRVLILVCNQVLRWQAVGVDFKISVNISVNDLEDTEFIRRIKLILARQGVRPGQFDFEITESGISSSVGQLNQPLQVLRDLGATVSIDDFGTGQSALSYLRHMPADYLKIDQSFVRALDSDPKDRVLVRSTIELAHELGIQVVAEGVETKAAYDILKSFGCDQAQGYCIARPVDAVAFEEWLNQRHAVAA